MREQGAGSLAQSFPAVLSQLGPKRVAAVMTQRGIEKSSAYCFQGFERLWVTDTVSSP